jgi:predicted transcriptional regulator
MAPKTVLGIRAKLPAPNDKEGLERIARDSNVPYHTLLKIANGQTEDPRVSTVEKLQRYFEEREAA